MIFVDTSVWVAAFRAGDGLEARTLRHLLDQDEVGLPIPVRIEILAGASSEDRTRLRKALSALPVYYPGAATWRLVDSWLAPAASAGKRFGLTDLLIGALAAEHEGVLWSLDSDFRRMASIGFVTLFEPAPS
ncbi:MAG TPA: PIN domain-containing protein [Thermoanaerobaculia bacterium]|nr:PIN domain-containing protein [Thermoanaerobaculia bacterium]